MQQIVQKIYRLARETHRVLYEDSLTTGKNLHELSIEELTDLAFGLRETLELLDDARKALTKVKNTSERFACLRCTVENKPDKIQTEYCSAETKIKHYAVYPAKRAKDPENFDELMKVLGVPQYLYEAEVLRINWEGMKEHCSKLTKMPSNPAIIMAENAK